MLPKQFRFNYNFILHLCRNKIKPIKFYGNSVTINQIAFFLFGQFLLEFKIYAPIGFCSIELLRNGQINCFSILIGLFLFVHSFIHSVAQKDEINWDSLTKQDTKNILYYFFQLFHNYPALSLLYFLRLQSEILLYS